MGVSIGGGGSSSTTSGYSVQAPPKYISNAYKGIISQAQNTAATPYTPYTGQLTAGLTDAQNTAIAGLGNAQGAYQPYYDQAANYGQQATTAITPMEFNQQTLSQYQNPYIQDVVNSTLGDLTRLFGQQQTQVTGNAISSGAWGGDRAGIVKSNLANNQANTAASTLAKLYSDSFNNAASQFNTANNAQMAAQQQNNANALSAANLYQGLGTGASTNAINLNQALMGAGTTQQATEQAGLDAAYQQFLNQQQYPFETLSWLTGIATGVGSNAGGVNMGSSTTSGSSYGGSLTGSSKAEGGRVLDMEPNGAGLYTLGDLVHGYASGGDVMPYADGVHTRPSGLKLPILSPSRGSGPPRGGIPDPGKPPAVPTVGASGSKPDLQAGLDKIKDSIAPPPNGAAASSAGAPIAGLGASPTVTYTPVQPAPALVPFAPAPGADAGTLGNAVGLARASNLSSTLPGFGMGLGAPFGYASGGAVGYAETDDEGVPLIFGPEPQAGLGAYPSTYDPSTLAALSFNGAGVDPLPSRPGANPSPHPNPESVGLAGGSVRERPDLAPARTQARQQAQPIYMSAYTSPEGGDAFAAPPDAGFGSVSLPVPTAGLGAAPAYGAPAAPQAGLGMPQAGNAPRGVRTNNPGNIKDSEFARSQPGYMGSDGVNAIFETPEAGYAAMNKLLDVYGNKHGLNTVSGILNRWAPASADNNDTSGYVSYVAKRLGIDPNAPLTPEARAALPQAMAYFENGREFPGSGNPLAVVGANGRIQMGGGAPRAGLGYADDEETLPANAQPVAGRSPAPIAGLQAPPQPLPQGGQVDDGKAFGAAMQAGLYGLLTTGNIGTAVQAGTQTYNDMQYRLRGLVSPNERMQLLQQQMIQSQADKLAADVEKARAERTQVVTNPNTGRSYLVDRVTGAKQLLDEGQTADLEIVHDSAGNPIGTLNKRTGATTPLPQGFVPQLPGLPAGVKPTSDYDNWRIAQAGGDTRTFAQYQEAMKKAGSAAGEGAEVKTLGEERGKAAASVEAAGRQAPDAIAKLDLLGGLLRRVNTGALLPTEAKAADWVQALGLDPARLGLDPNSPMTAQVAQKLINELTVGMIGPGGFPANNFSDADRKFISDIFPKISNRPESNEMALGILKRVQEKKLDYSEAWSDYQDAAKARGELPSFAAFERDYRRQHRNERVFGDLEAQLGRGSPSGSGFPPARSGSALGDAVGQSLGSGGSGAGGLPRANSPAEAMKLPPGTVFLDSEGRQRRVPDRRP
ncbi:hypothetical protein V5F79_08220 [Xanthobacter flavus]|uniref:hypothetical protein n=1 Tax=Xanthobacter flavus TaxID=281 RepID=UPI00372B991A